MVFYLHPWELDRGQPDVPGMSLAARLRHSGGTRTAELRLRRFLEEWGRKLTFMRMSDALTDGRQIRRYACDELSWGAVNRMSH